MTGVWAVERNSLVLRTVLRMFIGEQGEEEKCEAPETWTPKHRLNVKYGVEQFAQVARCRFEINFSQRAL
jgi:hypothetical protein